MKLSIIIINYRTASLTIDCLKSLLPEIDIDHGRVVVVDNRSNDGSVDTLKQWLVQNDANNLVSLVESESNFGFSAGNNLGIQAMKADNYLLLNSDTIVRPGAIAELMKCAAEHSQAGIISPRLEWPDATPQESCFRYPTPFSELVDVAATGSITKLFPNYVVALEVSDELVHPQWTSFACVLIKAEVLKKVGLLDDGFFMYFEDIEFCHRAMKAGWSIVHTPKAHVVHLRGGSSSVKSHALESKRLPRYYYASRSRLYYLLYGRAGLTLANVFWLLGASICKFRVVLGLREHNFPKKKWLDIWINWSRPAGNKNSSHEQKNQG